MEAGPRKLPQADRERLGDLQASTLHRLLGWRPDSSVRFRHNRDNRLPHDVIVVDETSMVSLTMMARLLEAVRPDARLVLVGDPDQLASVEAGAVLADLVDGFGARSDSPVEPLTTPIATARRSPTWRGAARRGSRSGDRGVRRGGRRRVHRPRGRAAMAEFRSRSSTRRADVRLAADAGDGRRLRRALDQHRLLCAHREGPYGVSGWNRQVEQLVGRAPGSPTYDEWYSGRPVLITANDKGQRLSNGDMGVTVRRGEGRLRVLLAELEGRGFAPTRLARRADRARHDRAQVAGVPGQTVSVIMPPEESRLLTRELFYTAVTRAQDKVRVIGTEESVRAAVARKVQRASGLARRLQDGVTAHYFSPDSASLICANSSSGALPTRWCRL